MSEPQQLSTDPDVLDPEPDVVDPEPLNLEPEGGAVAVRGEDRWTEPNTDWPHEWIELEGDRLAVRKPSTQALAAYSLSASRFVSPQTQNDVSGLFMARHMSPETYARVMDRFMDPDDPDYNEKTVGELMRQIVELRTNEITVPNRAERRHPSTKE